MTATLAPSDTGLDWVTVTSAGHDERCHWRDPRCGAQAVCRLVYEPVQGPCKGHEHPACLRHRDIMVRRAADGVPGINCSRRCGDGSRSLLVRIEPLR